MKRLFSYLGIALLAVFLIEGCGPSEEELRQQERARRDSLERVRMQRLEAARIDSLARVQVVEEEVQAAKEEKRREIRFSPNGKLTVQVGSWRSEQKANQIASMWVNRGFDQAYVTQYGDADSGDVWFRVRVGRVLTMNDAKALIEILKEEHSADAWVDMEVPRAAPKETEIETTETETTEG